MTKGLNMHSLATNLQLDISHEMFDEQDHFKDIDRSFADYTPALKAVAAELATLRHRAK